MELKKFDDYSKVNEQSELQKEYREVFQALLKKYKVKSVSTLSKDEKSKLFSEISDYWKKGQGPTKKYSEDFKDGEYIGESVGDLPTSAIILKNGDYKVEKEPCDGCIDLGKIDYVSNTDIYNSLTTHKGGHVIIKDGHFILCLKSC